LEAGFPFFIATRQQPIGIMFCSVELGAEVDMRATAFKYFVGGICLLAFFVSGCTYTHSVFLKPSNIQSGAASVHIAELKKVADQVAHEYGMRPLSRSEIEAEDEALPTRLRRAGIDISRLTFYSTASRTIASYEFQDWVFITGSIRAYMLLFNEGNGIIEVNVSTADTTRLGARILRKIGQTLRDRFGAERVQLIGEVGHEPNTRDIANQVFRC
jgi:hypothetical protein